MVIICQVECYDTYKHCFIYCSQQLHSFACIFQMMKPKHVVLTYLLRDHAVSYARDIGDTEVIKTHNQPLEVHSLVIKT